MRQQRRGQKGSNTLRIIGGDWRGRRLEFPSSPNLRPTGDRIRETLFNWLAPDIRGSRCLDLFAGSGALGLEALSRGASHCTFLETSAIAINVIGNHLTQLNAGGRGRVVNTNALFWQDDPFDIVFVDPPFSEGLAIESLSHLINNRLLTDGALVYLEVPSTTSLENLPTCLSVVRDKRTGSVRYLLLEKPP
ncbi:MAG: 16S rRNA (guanine(966)-N(2))-methyltransferase RsmD [Halieaceae bacterium]